MARPRFSIILLVLWFASSTSAGEVIFSRRVYKEHGASYQQIWTWNPADGALQERDHNRPTCNGRPKARPASRTQSCDWSAKRGNLEACGNEETLVVSRSGRQLGQFQIQVNTCPIDNHGTIGKCETPIRSLDWTEDGKWLLIGEEGLHDGSGQRQDDYYLVNLATMKLSPVASASNAFWLPGRDQIVYVTPQHLAPLPGGQGKHNVWVQQLMSFDPAKGPPTAITSDLSNNVDASWCEDAR
jgi:hypothetical protein